jgi:hypothetical protein
MHLALVTQILGSTFTGKQQNYKLWEYNAFKKKKGSNF